MPFLTKTELERIGFEKIGDNVKISDKAVFYNPKGIRIGDNSRIDDFCVLSAREISIGRNVHLSHFVEIAGQGTVRLEDFSDLSARVTLLTSNDDYSGEHMSNPTVPEEYREVTTGKIVIGKHVLVGAGSVVLPNVTIGEGARIGALSLVKAGSYDAFSVYAGVPVKYIKKSSNHLLELEKEYLDHE